MPDPPSVLRDAPNVQHILIFVLSASLCAPQSLELRACADVPSLSVPAGTHSPCRAHAVLMPQLFFPFFFLVFTSMNVVAV